MTLTIWHQDELAQIPITKKVILSPLELSSIRRFLQPKQNKISTNHMVIYHSDRFDMSNQLSILQQFNLDFDRELVKINGIKCKSRLLFFRTLIPYFRDSLNFNRILFLVQQTPFAYILEDIYRILRLYGLNYAIIDSGKISEIDVNKIPDKNDLIILVSKEMNLVDPIDFDVVKNIVEINIVLESLKEDVIYVYLNFKCPFTN